MPRVTLNMAVRQHPLHASIFGNDYSRKVCRRWLMVVRERFPAVWLVFLYTWSLLELLRRRSSCRHGKESAFRIVNSTVTKEVDTFLRWNKAITWYLYTDLHTWEIFSELWPVLQRRICFQVNSDVRRDDESMHPFRLYMVGNVRTAHAMDLPAMPGW